MKVCAAKIPTWRSLLQAHKVEESGWVVRGLCGNQRNENMIPMFMKCLVELLMCPSLGLSPNAS